MKKQYDLPRNPVFSTYQHNPLSQSMLNHQYQPSSHRPHTQQQQHSQPKYQESHLPRNNHSLHLINYKQQNAQSEIAFTKSPPKEEVQSLTFLKQNMKGSTNEQQQIIRRLRQLQKKMKESEIRLKQNEGRIQKAERLTKNNQKISMNIEEIMKMQLTDIKFNNDLQKRLDTIQSNISYLNSSKTYKKQLQKHESNIPSSKLIDMSQKIEDLIHHAQDVEQEIQAINMKFSKMIEKIEQSLMNMGKQYEQFIESNLIKTIEQMNRLSQHYHQEIQSFKKDKVITQRRIDGLVEMQQRLEMKIDQDMLQYQKRRTQGQNIYRSHVEVSKCLIGVIPHLKLEQSLKIIHDKSRLQPTKSSFKSLDPFSDNILNSLYDKIDKQISSDSTELLFEKVTYKLDTDFYLLDEDNLYITDLKDRRIQLNLEQIQMLRRHLMVESQTQAYISIYANYK